jgi:pyruvate kinase
VSLKNGYELKLNSSELTGRPYELGKLGILADSSLPKFVSAYHPDVPIVVFCSSSKIGRQLIVYRGIHPVVRHFQDALPGKRPAKAIQYAKELGFIQEGDDVVIVGVESDEDVGDLMTMKICTCK